MNCKRLVVNLIMSLVALGMTTAAYSYSYSCNVTGIDEHMANGVVALKLENCSERRLKYVAVGATDESGIASRLVQYGVMAMTSGKKVRLVFNDWDRLRSGPDGHGGSMYILEGFDRIIID